MVMERDDDDRLRDLIEQAQCMVARVQQATDELLTAAKAVQQQPLLGVRWRGPYESGERYELGDVVTSVSASAWLYLGAPGRADPPPGPAWRLMLKGARRGRDGRPGPRGERGDKGERGDVGPLGVGVLDAFLEGGELVLVMTDQSERRLPLY